MFNVKSLDETKILIRQKLNNFNLKEESKVSTEASGRIISKDIYSMEELPNFNKSTVDGFAVLYEDIKLASESSPALLRIVGEVHMGKECSIILKPGEAVKIPTGGHVPVSADVCVMIENTQQLNDDILIFKKSSKYDNILQKGSDIKKGELFINKNTRVTPRVIGSLMSQNIVGITCFKRLAASVISTGDEIVENTVDLRIGEVRDINSYTITNHVINNGVDVIDTIIVKDDFEKYKSSIIKAFETSDIVISSGGSSVGEKDYTDKILNEMGAEIFLHGLNVKPGKPTILALYKEKLFIGLPGHPTSAFVVLTLLLEEILNAIFKQNNFGAPYLEATLKENVHNNTGRTLIQLVTLDKRDKLIAVPIYTKSAMINVIKNAYGYIVVDQFSEGVYKDTLVKVYKLGD